MILETHRHKWPNDDAKTVQGQASAGLDELVQGPALGGKLSLLTTKLAQA